MPILDQIRITIRKLFDNRLIEFNIHDIASCSLDSIAPFLRANPHFLGKNLHLETLPSDGAPAQLIVGYHFDSTEYEIRTKHYHDQGRRIVNYHRLCKNTRELTEFVLAAQRAWVDFKPGGKGMTVTRAKEIIFKTFGIPVSKQTDPTFLMGCRLKSILEILNTNPRFFGPDLHLDPDLVGPESQLVIGHHNENQVFMAQIELCVDGQTSTLHQAAWSEELIKEFAGIVSKDECYSQ